MKILLVAINAKYVHTNLAVRDLLAFAEASGDRSGAIEIAEYTINQLPEQILADIYRKRPDVIAFSCYIWNIRCVKRIFRDYAKIDPHVAIWLGGPEVSFDAADLLEAEPVLAGVMCGEGERAFSMLCDYYLGGNMLLESIPGIVFRTDREHVADNGPALPVPMDEIPFVYGDMSEFDHRIPYYETSRGCPFSCSYCLSSLDRVRFRSLDLVKRELQFFLDSGVRQVKFVDRTFNCSRPHADAIWRYLAAHDNGVTNFHFEIAADLLTGEELELLAEMRPGLVQLEIGVQSANEDTIRAIDRVQNLGHLKEVVGRIREGGNIHQHLDLIAGLPYEDRESFARSFNEVYSMRPQQLQLGFLKLLRGSRIRKDAGRYGIVYSSEAPYEVLRTEWLSYEDILELKEVEEITELYLNSHQFDATVCYLMEAFATPWDCVRALAVWYRERHLFGKAHSRLGKIEILREFCASLPGKKDSLRVDELLLLDLYMRENSRRRPEWAPESSEYREIFRGFFRREAESPELLKNYAGFDAKQMAHMTHQEVFHRDILHLSGHGPWAVIFDYRNRNPLTGNARMLCADLGREKPEFTKN